MVDPFGDQDSGRREIAQASRRPAPPPDATPTESDPGTRLHLCRLAGLFALAQLMAQAKDEHLVLRLAGSSVPSLGPLQLLGIHVTGRGWYDPAGSTGSSVAGLDSQLPRLAQLGGALSVPGQAWAWAFGMRCREGLLGHLAVSANNEPAPGVRFLVGVLAQQTAFALANARLRRHATELEEANTAFATTLSGSHETLTTRPSGDPMVRRVDDAPRTVDADEAVGDSSAGVVPDHPTTNPARADTRESLARLRGLLVLGQLMAEGRDEDQLLRLASSSVSSFGALRLVGIHLSGIGWYEPPGIRSSPPDDPDIEEQLAHLEGAGGPLTIPGEAWAWGFCLRSLEGPVGHLAVSADAQPTTWAQFLLGIFAQQTASALANARLYARLRTQAGELRDSNSALATTVSALKRSMTIHDRLTRVAVAGEGEEGIARALHDLTGWPVAIEDRYGNLRAWEGPGRPDPYPKQSQQAREVLIRKARAAEQPIMDGDRLVTIASPRADVVGVIVLVGVPPTAAEEAHTAMEHGSTVLSMELARVQSVAETELRLGRDLVEELLANTDERAALGRAQALGYDLRRQHRVAIVVEDPPRRRDPDSRLRAIRRAAFEAGLGRLLVPRGEAVVVVAHDDAAWEAFQSQLVSEVGRNVWVGVGGLCEDLRDFPRSYHEARLALRMRNTRGQERRTLFYEQLGAYRLLAEVGELGAIDRFVEEWIGALVAYDSKHGADLVSTLSSYLECRGNYDATAAALSVHRNTVKYRLRRIREISHHDLKDADTLFNLQLATRAWTTRRALETREGEMPPAG